MTHRDDLAAIGFDARFARLWEFYFSYCEAGFDERYVSVAQLAYASPDWKSRAPADDIGTRRDALTV